MQIHVINLKSRPDRRQHVDHAFAATDISYDFFPAIDSPDALEKNFKGKKSWQCMLETGRFGSNGEIGCYSSHLALWRKCIELNQPMVIMEDDFKLAENFSAALGYVAGKIDACGFVRMEALEKRWRNKPGLSPVTVASDGEFNLVYQRMPSVRLTCYCITPACAQALVEVSQYFCAPVDHVVRRMWVHKQPIFALEPPAILLADTSYDSSLGARQKSPLRHLFSPVRALYRYTERQRTKAQASIHMRSEPICTWMKSVKTLEP